MAILASAESIERYGPSDAVLRNVATEFESSHPELAYAVHLANWNGFRDASSLVRLVPLAFRLGKSADAFAFARIARYLGERFDPFSLFPETPLPAGQAFVESVLAMAIVEDPNRVRYLNDEEAARFLKQSRDAEGAELRTLPPDSPEALEARLRAVEFRALTLLDANEASSYVRLILGIADGTEPFSGDRSEFLSEWVSGPVPAVPAAYAEFRFDSEKDPDGQTVAESLWERLTIALEHFYDPALLFFYRDVEALFSKLDAPSFVGSVQKTVRELEARETFFSSLPDSVRQVRDRLFSEVSGMRTSAYYPRLRAGMFCREGGVFFREASVGALLYLDALSFEEFPEEILGSLSKAVFERDPSPGIASAIGFALSRRERYEEAVEWFARSDLENVENLGMLLRIVADFPHLSNPAVRALGQGAPMENPSEAYVLARLRSVTADLPHALAGEILGDAERAFGSARTAEFQYLRAWEEGENADALKKLADIRYESGRFEEAEKAYRLLHFSGRYPEVVGKLCLSALERGEFDRATELFSEIDQEDPSNAEAVAAYYFSFGDLFQGLSLLSNLSSKPSALLFGELRTAYAEYAASLVGTAFDDSPDEDFLDAVPSRLLGFRTMAATLDEGPSAAAEYFRFAASCWKKFAGTEYEGDVCEAVIGILAPVHSKDAFGYVSDESNLRRECVADLFFREGELLSAQYREGAFRQVSREAYSSMLLEIAELFRVLGDDRSAFFREAGASATLGLPSDVRIETAVPASVSIH